MSIIAAECCCGLCFNCKGDPWYLRACKFDGEMGSLPAALTDTVFNFGQFYRFTSFGEYYVTEPVSVPGHFDVTQRVNVRQLTPLSLSTSQAPGIARQVSVDGYIDFTIRFSEVKLRLVLREWYPFYFSPSKPCMHTMCNLQLSWRHTITEINSVNVRLFYTGNWQENFAVISRFYTDINSFSVDYFIPDRTVLGYTAVQPFNASWGWGWNEGYDSGIWTASDDCEKEWTLPHGTAIAWGIDLSNQFNWSGTRYLPLRLALGSGWHTHPGNPPLTAPLGAYTNHWVGSQLQRINLGALSTNLWPAYHQPKSIIKSSNTFGSCTANPNPEPPVDEPLSISPLYGIAL